MLGAVGIRQGTGKATTALCFFTIISSLPVSLCHLQLQVVHRMIPKFPNSVKPAWIAHSVFLLHKLILASNDLPRERTRNQEKDLMGLICPCSHVEEKKNHKQEEVLSSLGHHKGSHIVPLSASLTPSSILMLVWVLFFYWERREGKKCWYQHWIHPNFLTDDKPKALQVSISARSHCLSSLIFLLSHEKLNSRKNKQLGHHPPISLVWDNMEVSVFPYLQGFSLTPSWRLISLDYSNGINRFIHIELLW